MFDIFWSSKLQEIGEGEVGEQVVSEGWLCDVPARTEKGKRREGVELEAFVSSSNFPASLPKQGRKLGLQIQLTSPG